MFLGVYDSARGFVKKSYSSQLVMALPEMNINTRARDIESMVIEDRELKWGFHNPKLIGKLLSGHNEVSIISRCSLPMNRSRIIGPSATMNVEIDHPIVMTDMVTFVKFLIEDYTEMYKNTDIGYFDMRVNIRTTATNN